MELLNFGGKFGESGGKFGGKFGGKLEESLCRNGAQVCMISKVSSEESLEESWGKLGESLEESLSSADR